MGRGHSNPEERPLHHSLPDGWSATESVCESFAPVEKS